LAGRLTGETSAAGYTVTLVYNIRSLLEQVTNGRGQNITYTYDDAGRLNTATGLGGTVSYTTMKTATYLPLPTTAAPLPGNTTP